MGGVLNHILMLLLSQCIQVLNESNNTYTTEEVERLRILLYQLGEKDYQIFKQKLNEQESSAIYAGFNDRAS